MTNKFNNSEESRYYRFQHWLERAKNKWNDRFDYSEVVYINSATKISIICQIHGRFEQIPMDHINSKHGCPKCGTQSGVLVCINRDINHFSIAAKISNQRPVEDRLQSAEKAKQTRIQKGDFVSDDNLEAWDCYKRQIGRLTYSTRKLLEEDLSKIGRSNNDLQVDHIVSKLDGFRNGVDPKIISHPINLRVIPASENRLKSSRSDMTIKELMRKIEEYDNSKRHP